MHTQNVNPRPLGLVKATMGADAKAVAGSASPANPATVAVNENPGLALVACHQPLSLTQRVPLFM